MELFKQLPDKRYKTLVIDPPWPISLCATGKGRHHKADKLPYRVLTLEEIKTFPMPALAETGSHVYCWTTNKMLPVTFSVLEAWGCRYHLTMPLVKRSGICPLMQGYVFGSEFCLLAFYGKPMQPFTGIGLLNWLETNPQPGRHSSKPDAFYSLVEAMSPGPRVDLFARTTRPGWDTWGDELPSTG